MSTGSYIECANVGVTFNGVRALNDISIKIGTGEVVAIVGKNGSGKTTLMSVLEGILAPSKGYVKCRLEGRVVDLDEFKKNIGVQLQRTSHFKQLKVVEVLKLYSKIAGKPLDRNRIYECVDLHDIEDKEIRVLSGGQLQKVNVALAVLKDAKFTFFDEPTVGLDVSTREKYIEYLRRTRSSARSTVLITHYMDEVESICTKVLVLKEGAAAEFMSPEELKSKYLKGKTVRVAVACGHVNAVLRLLEGIDCAHWFSDSCLYITTDHAEAVISAVYGDEEVSSLISDVVIKAASLQDAIVRITS